MTIDRVVVDTNVLISAILSKGGTPSLLFDAMRIRRVTLLFSESSFDELQDRLLRPKFDRYVSAELRRRFLAQIDAVSEYVAIAEQKMGCRDPDDDKLLETAILGDADLLISGDNDLLAMNPFQGLEICRTADALKRIEA